MIPPPLTPKERWRRDRDRDPIAAYVDDFFSLPVLIAVFAGMAVLSIMAGWMIWQIWTSPILQNF